MDDLVKDSITCPLCGRTSWHIDDIKEKYCGHCHKFHDDGRHVVELWLTAEGEKVYDPGMDTEDLEDRQVRVGNRIIGYIDQVLEVRPEAIKVRLAIKSDVFPYNP